MGLKLGFIGAKAARLCGKKYDDESQNRTIQLCRQGALDVAVVSVKSGKNGCNLQGMSWMVSLGYIAQAIVYQVFMTGIVHMYNTSLPPFPFLK